MHERYQLMSVWPYPSVEETIASVTPVTNKVGPALMRGPDERVGNI